MTKQYLINEPNSINFFHKLCMVAKEGGIRTPTSVPRLELTPKVLSVDVPDDFEEPDNYQVPSVNLAKAAIMDINSVRMVDKVIDLAKNKNGYFTGEVLPDNSGIMMVFPETVEKEPAVTPMQGKFNNFGKDISKEEEETVDVKKSQSETDEENPTTVDQESEQETETKTISVPVKFYTKEELNSVFTGPQLKELCDEYGIPRRKSKLNCIKDILKYYEQFQ